VNPIRWMFENRETGRITIAQWPNAPLWLWIVATAVDRVTGAGLGLVADVGLGVWAVLEVVKGVNPFRRLLGAGALVSLALSRL
jgi:hypothetical protein